MSFFGFDPSQNPTSRGHPSKAPGFGETPDHFAGLSFKQDIEDEEGIDFEDTYDGLGDGLDETDDVLNDDTFGGASTTMGKDFDFHGSTARVANVLHEEQAVYSYKQTSAKKQPTKPPPPAAHVAASVAASDSRQLPALVPDMSLWGAPSAPAHDRGQAPSQESVQHPPTGPGGRKFMSLEEVEAQILAMNKKPAGVPLQAQAPPPQQQQHQQHAQFPASQPPPLAQFHHQIPPHTPSPGAHLQQFQPPPSDPHAFGLQQLPPHLQHMLQQSQNQLPQHLQQAHQERFVQQQRLQRELHLQQQQQQQQQQQLNQQQHQHQHQHQPPLQPPAVSVPARNQYGMVGASQVPAHQLQAMDDADRLRYLEDESKRLKRNHKIAQLARYNGLMTPQDKNFIQRIQLQQLVSIGNTEDNANEDFYYIVHSAIRARQNPQQPLSQLAQTYLFRSGGRGNKRQDNHLHRMEQQVARAVAAAKARPKTSQLVLEGSLGKISFSNVKTPRPMLNIKRQESSSGEPRTTQRSTHSIADRKSLLKIIETVYDVLLELEMHERERSKLPPLQSEQPAEVLVGWDQKRNELVESLYDKMKVLEPIDPSSPLPHPFIAILSYSKMKRAIPRVFRHLDAEKRVTILTMIVVHLDVLDVVKHGIYHPDETQLPSAFREEIEMFANNVLPPLLGYMYEAPLSIVVGLLTLLLDRVDVRLVSRTKIGLAFLTMFFSRAEILKQAGQAEERELMDWQAIYERFFVTLEGYWMECFPPSGRFVDDQYVWQFLASMAVGANMMQQQTLVAAVKDRVLDNVQASKVLPPEIGVQKRENVNLFMRAMGLDVDLLG